MMSRPRKIGYVVKMYPRFSETFIVNEVLAHEAAGLDLEIFSLRPPIDGRFHESLARVRAPVRYLPSGRPAADALWSALVEARRAGAGLDAVADDVEVADAGDVHQALVLARAVREAGVTHLHAHFGSVATTVARLAGRIARVPYTFTAHAKDIFHEQVREGDLRAKLRDAEAVVTVSDFNVRYLRERFGDDAAKVRRVYNGLDLEAFAYDAPAARPAHIVAVGRLVEKKGFGDLVDACAILARRGRRFRCSIVGDGPLHGELRRHVEARALAGVVELGGPCSQEAVKRRVRQASVFAAPCVVGNDGNRDGLPTVLLEAMALGTPCVSTDVTGIPELVRDRDTGLVVPQRDCAALAGALDRLIADAGERVRLAANARRLVESEFDVHRNSERMRELFAGAA